MYHQQCSFHEHTPIPSATPTAMRAPQCVVALLSLSLLPAVQSFCSVPLPGRIGASPRALLKSTPRGDSNLGPNTEPIPLPPADYSKPGRVVNLVSWVCFVGSDWMLSRSHVVKIVTIPHHQLFRVFAMGEVQVASCVLSPFE